MKKVSVLITILLIVTMGGVYATWSYAEANAAESHQHMSINLESATTNLAEGVIHNVINSMNVLIDDADDDYTAEITVTGKMGFVFVPNAGASDDVVADGIAMQWQLEQTDPGVQHGGVNIFTITQNDPEALTSTKITNANAATAFDVDLSTYIGGFYVEVDATAVSEVLSIDLELPTYEDYTTFKGELATTAGKLGITISKVTG